METNTKIKGTFSSTLRGTGELLCAVIIAVMPKCGLCLAAYLNIAGLLGFSLTRYYRWIFPVLLLLLLSNFVITYLKARRLDDYRPFIFSILGTGMLLLGKFFVHNVIVSYLGVGMLMVAVVLQLVQSRKSCSAMQPKWNNWTKS